MFKWPFPLDSTRTAAVAAGLSVPVNALGIPAIVALRGDSPASLWSLVFFTLGFAVYVFIFAVLLDVLGQGRPELVASDRLIIGTGCGAVCALLMWLVFGLSTVDLVGLEVGFLIGWFWIPLMWGIHRQCRNEQEARRLNQ